MPMDGGSMLKDMLSPDPKSKKADRAVGVISKSVAFIVLVIGMVFFQLYLILLGIYILIPGRQKATFLPGRNIRKSFLLNVITHTAFHLAKNRSCNKNKDYGIDNRGEMSLGIFKKVLMIYILC